MSSEFHTSPRRTVPWPKRSTPHGSNRPPILHYLHLMIFPTNNWWVFSKIGVGPQNGWFISWKTLLKLMIWGYHYFWKHPDSLWNTLDPNASHMAPDHRCPYGHDLPVHVVVQRRGHSGTPEDRCINSLMIVINCELCRLERISQVWHVMIYIFVFILHNYVNIVYIYISCDISGYAHWRCFSFNKIKMGHAEIMVPTLCCSKELPGPQR